MAKIGIKNFRWSTLTESATGVPSYDGAKAISKAVSCSVEVESNTAELYADDSLAETDYSFVKANVTLGLSKEDDEVYATLLGHDYTDGEIVRKSTDAPIYVGLGRIVTMIVGGARKYKVEFLPKVKFNEPTQQNDTKGENTEFGTYELSGVAFALADGTWSKAKTFDTETEALTYLTGLMAVSS